MDFSRWDAVERIIAMFALIGWVNVVMCVLTRPQPLTVMAALAMAVLCTAATFGWLPDGPIVLLIATLLAFYGARTLALNRREGWADGLALFGAAAYVVGAGLDRLAPLIGQPDGTRAQDAWMRAGLILLAPGLLTSVLEDSASVERRLFRFLGRSLLVTAAIGGLAYLMHRAGILPEWQVMVVMVSAVTVWCVTALAYIFTGGFGCARKEQRNAEDLPPHATQR